MTPYKLLENISALPPNARREVFDFIEFMVKKYQKEKQDVLTANTGELSIIGKDFIDDRLQKMKDSSGLKSWKDIRDSLIQDKT